MLLLDVAKAFNCIDHEILYVKMRNAGFGETVVKWFKSYLRRFQRVKLDNKLSDVMPVGEGIAQGTVLGPIIFIFYINDMFKCIRHAKMSLFADDCVLYLSGNNWSDIHRKIQSDFDRVVDWTYRNSLRLNYGKTKAIIFGSRSKLANIHRKTPFNMGNREIGFVNHHLYLGIMLDNTMSLLPLAKDIKKRISNKIFTLRKIRKYITFDSAVAIYKQTILPIIDYAGFLLVTCTKEVKRDFQILQNDILRISNFCRLSYMIPIEEMHKNCKIISLEQRMRMQLLWLMFILSKDESFLKVHNRVTRNAEKIVFKVPTKILPVYEHSPYYVGSKLWTEGWIMAVAP